MLDLPSDKKIILFDGVCNLCNTAVQYIIERDKNDVFRFVALQSEMGIKIQNHLGLNNTQLDSIILYEPGVAYFVKSQAAFQIAKNLTGPVKIFGLFSSISGKFTDVCYDYVAKNRYGWYGKKEQCWIPTPELKKKFL
jgi:predicted DCC family thiol-disulfide oxidoreductase YuxK